MAPLRSAAPGAHTRVQTAVGWVNRAETTLAAARIKETAAGLTSKAATASAAATAGATSGAAVTAAAAHTEAIAATQAAEADLRAARAEHSSATQAWESLRSDAAGIHTDMESSGEIAKRAIHEEAQKRFAENPSGLAALGASISDWFSDNADWLSTLSEVNRPRFPAAPMWVEALGPERRSSSARTRWEGRIPGSSGAVHCPDHSTHAAVAYSTSESVLYGPSWKIDERMHSAL